MAFANPSISDVIATTIQNRSGVIADKAGGYLEAEARKRHAVLADEDDVARPVRVIIKRDDRGSPDAARPADIFPAPALFGGDETPLPHHLFGQVGIAVFLQGELRRVRQKGALRQSQGRWVKGLNS